MPKNHTSAEVVPHPSELAAERLDVEVDGFREVTRREREMQDGFHRPILRSSSTARGGISRLGEAPPRVPLFRR